MAGGNHTKIMILYRRDVLADFSTNKRWESCQQKCWEAVRQVSQDCWLSLRINAWIHQETDPD